MHDLFAIAEQVGGQPAGGEPTDEATLSGGHGGGGMAAEAKACGVDNLTSRDDDNETASAEESGEMAKRTKRGKKKRKKRVFPPPQRTPPCVIRWIVVNVCLVLVCRVDSNVQTLSPLRAMAVMGAGT